MKKSTVTLLFCLLLLIQGVSLYARYSANDNVTKQIRNCEVIALPLAESFEDADVFPPECWENTSASESLWTRVSYGDYPVCRPHDGDFMLKYNSFNYQTGKKGTIITREFQTGGKDQLLSFWLYRDNDGMYANATDRVNVYVSPTTDIAELAPVITAYRYMMQQPVSSGTGWYNYLATLPCGNMETAFVIFEGVSDNGNNIYLDMIQIGDICFPAKNINTNLYEENGKNVHITWEAPDLITSTFESYKIYKNELEIASVTDALSYKDLNVSAGSYTYCVKAIYNNTCGSSEALCSSAPVVVTKPGNCNPPEELTSNTHTDDWFDVDLQWKDPTGVTLFYTSAEPKNLAGGGLNPASAVRFAPSDLTEYHDGKLSSVSFVPYEPGINYEIKIWQGGSYVTYLDPGELVYSQMVSADELEAGFIWNTIKLTNPPVIDATRELWIGIAPQNPTGSAVGCDAGPIKRNEYSNLAFFNGEWKPMNELYQYITYNCCIKGRIRTASGTDEVLGYNVYRNGEPVNNNQLVVGLNYRDRTPGTGSYQYEVSAVYDNYSESQNKAKVPVKMEQNPCIGIWQIPINEGFENERFSPWCWELFSASNGANWERITEGNTPICIPHSGEGMAQFSRKYGIGRTGLLISPRFATESDLTFSFWMNRDEGQPNEEKVNIYLNNKPDIDGLTPLLTVYRSTEKSPVTNNPGWNRYTVTLPCADMDGAYVMIEGTSYWGSNIFIDDIAVYDPLACDQVRDVVIEQPREGIVNLSWTAPVNDGVTGYRIIRDETVIGDNLQTTFISDTVTVGVHKYSFITLYDKPQCNESQPLQYDIDAYVQCDPATGVVAEVKENNEVQLNWEKPNAIDVRAFSIYRDDTFLTETTLTGYIDKNAGAGPHIYSIIVNYKNKPAATSEAALSNEIRIDYCVTVSNLKAEATSDAIILTWDYSGGEGFPETVLHEGFTKEIPSGWLNMDKDGDEYFWNHFYTGGYNRDGYIYSSSYIIGEDNLSPDNWFITPAVKLTGPAILRYHIRRGNIKRPNEHYGIYVSTTGTNYEDFKLLYEETLTGSAEKWQQREVNIPGYYDKAYIAFRHHNATGADNVMIDEVSVINHWGAPSFDIYKDDKFLANVKERSYTDHEVQPKVRYNYSIRPAYTSCVVEPVSVSGQIGICDPVTNLSATATPQTRKVTLTWQYTGSGAMFEIYRDNILYHRTEALTFVDEVEYDMTYQYCVKPLYDTCPDGAEDCTSILIENPVGIDNITGKSINIYPNPASETIRIESSGQPVEYIRIVDVAGRIVDEIKSRNNSTIDISDYTNGIYFFEINGGIYKVIKQ